MFSKIIERVADHYDQKLPFVVYRKPKEDRVSAIFQNSAELHLVKNFTETGFVFAPFDATKPSVLLQVNEKLEAVFTSQKTSRTAIGGIEGMTDFSQKEFHIDLVRKGIDKIHQGLFKKVVLSRKVEERFKASPLDLFQELLKKYDTAFCYLWFHPKVGMWLGATPEILLKTENKGLTTMSLAGTQKYTGDENPVWGKKELEEQELVTHYILDALSDKVSDIQIGALESVRAGNLWHLRTKLSGLVQEDDLMGIVNALHPTPAVCGMPMAEAKKFVLKNEHYDREYYTGYLGELNFKTERERSSNKRNQENKAYKTIKSTTTLFVNLRCMQLQDTKAIIYVGGGVTQYSQPEKEWEELVAKSTTMLQVLKNV